MGARITRRGLLVMAPTTLVWSLAPTVVGANACGKPLRVWHGVDVTSGQEVALRATTMPEGVTFTGSYLSPHLGLIALVQRDHHVGGTYRGCEQCPSSVTGRIEGEVVGNLAEVSWTEVDGEVTREGTGYFLIDVDGGRGPVRLFGERELCRPTHTAPRTWTAHRI